jgi:hypothetical protein
VPDVSKILKELESKSAGPDPEQDTQEGCFGSFPRLLSRDVTRSYG